MLISFMKINVDTLPKNIKSPEVILLIKGIHFFNKLFKIEKELSTLKPE